MAEIAIENQPREVITKHHTVIEVGIMGTTGWLENWESNHKNAKPVTEVSFMCQFSVLE